MILLIVALVVLIGVGLVVVLYFLNRDKNESVKTYKKLRKEKADSEVRLLRNLKGNINSKMSDDVIKNIMGSRNTILENALKDDLDNVDISKRLRK
jgi:flagellar basal body-associated protein FliL